MESKVKVDIGVFAHNEGLGIAQMVRELERQDLDHLDARILILANGCTDDTVERAREAVSSSRIEVFSLAKGGKSRTWNSFVHDMSRPDADFLAFVDADIVIPPKQGVATLVKSLRENPALHAFNSHPIKDIVHEPLELGPLDRVIAMSSETLNDWKTAICGSLYAMPANKARRLFLPIGLAVEDGMLRALILTDALQSAEQLERISGGDVFHIFKSERSISALIKHQIRIVIGSSVNLAVFDHLRSLPAGSQYGELARAAKDETWLNTVLREQFPRWPFGWVPWHFLVKRIAFLAKRPSDLIKPKRVLVLIVGFCFDLVVFVAAQIRMARGTGAGHW